MTTTQPRSRSAVYALVAAKAMKTEVVGWNRGYHNGDVDQTRVALDEVLLEMTDQGLITLGKVPYQSSHTFVEVAHGGVTAAPADLCGPLAKGSDRANAALWLWLLVHGTELGSYGSDYPWGDNGEIAHLFMCGLNLSESTAVRDDVWTEWGGTFGDGDRKAGVSGEATCNCEDVENYKVTAEVDSITSLLRQILGV